MTDKTFYFYRPTGDCVGGCICVLAENKGVLFTLLEDNFPESYNLHNQFIPGSNFPIKFNACSYEWSLVNEIKVQTEELSNIVFFDMHDG